jgi:hypothetical protein
MATRKSASRRTQDAIDNSTFIVPGLGSTPRAADGYTVDTPWGKLDVAALLRRAHDGAANTLVVQQRNQALVEALVHYADHDRWIEDGNGVQMYAALENGWTVAEAALIAHGYGPASSLEGHDEPDAGDGDPLG